MENLRGEYSKRKEAIKARLADFSRINEKDYFYEMCFCICTPQSSAFKSDRAVKFLIENDFKNKNIEPSNFLVKAGVRFHKNKGEYLKELKRNYSILLNKIKETKNQFELREFLVKNVKGYGYKEASLPYDEKIFILIDKKPRLIEIETFFDNYNLGLYRNKTVETFAFNPKTLRYETAPITNVLRHIYKKDLYKINLVTGRIVKVTGDHSVFGLKNTEVVPIPVRDLHKGDFITVPRRLNLKIHEEKELNLIKLFIKNKIFDKGYVRSKPYCIYLRKKYRSKISRKNQYVQHFRGIIPLKVIGRLPKEAYSNQILKKCNVKIGFWTSPTNINSIINLDENFFWIVGIMIAEASITKNPIEFTLGLEEYGRHLKLNRLLKKVFGTVVKSYKPKNKNAYVSKVNNNGFFYLINNVLNIKGKALTKKVPEIVFNSSHNNRLTFLQGYWEGDGWKKSKINLSVSTSSIELANSLLYLFLSIGVLARICKKSNRYGKGGPSYCIEVDNVLNPKDISKKKFLRKREIIPNLGQLLHTIHKNLGIKSKISSIHTKLYNKIMRWKLNINEPTRSNLLEVLKEFSKYKTTKDMVLIKKLINSDLAFLKIKDIKKIHYNKRYVYDLEVASKNKNYQNFVGGFGAVCLHNSHFLRNIGKRDLAILDRHILKNLKNLKAIDELPKALTKKKYLEIEGKFKAFSNKIKIPIDELDLLFWSQETGEIFK